MGQWRHKTLRNSAYSTSAGRFKIDGEGVFTPQPKAGCPVFSANPNAVWIAGAAEPAKAAPKPKPAPSKPAPAKASKSAQDADKAPEPAKKTTRRRRSRRTTKEA